MPKWFKRVKRKPKSDNIRKFVDIQYQFRVEHPKDLCPPETDPQLVVNCLCDVFLGPDWYVAFPIGPKQVNTIILDEILRAHSMEYRKLIEEAKRKVRENK